MFDQYTENGKNYQYFFFNFNANIPSNLKMIAFTMDTEGEITSSSDRYNKNFGDPLKYLNSIGVKEKIFAINSRMRMEKVLKEPDFGNYGDRLRLRYTVRKYIDSRGREQISYVPQQNTKNVLLRLALNALIRLKNSNMVHLDLILNKYENNPTEVYDEVNYDYKKHYEDFNVFSYLIQNYDEVKTLFDKIKTSSANDEYGSSKFEILSKNDFINVLKKIYLSNIQLKGETKRALLLFLKDNDVDILKLSQLKKYKKNQDLSAEEFGMLAKQGENLKPVIQNKLSSIRRGEDVYMTETEINYAIDNGFRDIILQYYKKMLPRFRDNQLSYENLNVYKKLGLLKEISQVIISKVKMYGINSLNSIEKSVYDMANFNIKS